MAKAKFTIERQAQTRLRTLDARIAKLQAERDMIERMLLIEGRSQGLRRPIMGIRKNSAQKLSVESYIRSLLEEADGKDVEAKAIFARLKTDSYAIKPTTFRSYLKRLVEVGRINRSKQRGFYYVPPLSAEVKDGIKERSEDRAKLRRSFNPKSPD